MPNQRFLVVLFASLAACVASGAKVASGEPAPLGSSAWAAQHLACDGVADDTTALRHLIAEASGRTVSLPAGCRILVGSPGPGGTAFTLPSDTGIRCEDESAGFLLARRRCADGPLAGAACRTDEDCLSDGSHCAPDLPGAPEFAHRVCAGTAAPCTVDDDCEDSACRPAEVPFTVFGTVPNAENVSVVGCSFDIRQRSQNEDERLLYGTCNGGAADGRPCAQLCTGAPAGTKIACNRDAQCEIVNMGTCSHADACGEHEAGPGDCGDEAKQPGSPAGSSPVNVIDFSTTRHALVKDVAIWDHVYGGFAVSLGDDGRLFDSTVGAARSEQPSGLFVGAGVMGRPAYMRRDAHVEAAVISGQQGIVSRNEIHAGAIGVRVGRNSQVNGNIITCADRGAWWYRYCAEDSARSHDLRKTCETDGDCNGSCVQEGPDCIGVSIQGDQNSVVGNRIYATYTGIRGESLGFNTTVSDNRVVYGEGPKLSFRGSGWMIADNYLAWGTKPTNGPLVKIGPDAPPRDGILSDHLVFTGNLLFGDKGPEYEGLAYVRLENAGDGRHRDVLVSSNQFLMKSTHVGIDLSELRTSVAGNVAIIGNAFFGGGIGARFPENAGRIRGAVVSGNTMPGTTEPLAGWSWEMGEALANAPLAPTDDAVHVIYLRNGGPAALEPGIAVAVQAEGAGNSVVRAPSGSHRIAGIVLGRAEPGQRVRIATNGTTRCKVDVGWFSGLAPGAELAVGNEGLLVRTDRAELAVAMTLAMEPESDFARCLIH